MVRKPENYPWSSYRAHADGATDPLLADHALYQALGASPAAHSKAYRALFRSALPDAFVDDLRSATHGGWALGSPKWRTKVERVAKRRATARPPGRPRKAEADRRQGQLL